MLSIETKARLKTLLLAIAEGEIGLEDSRQSLAAVPLFEPYAAFNRLDRSGAGYLSSKDFLRYLRYYALFLI